MLRAVIFMVLAVGVNNAIKIDGEDLTIDEIIVKASNGSDSLPMDPNSILVELDMLFKVDEYVKMRMEQEEEEKEKLNGRMKRKARIPESRYRWTNRIIPYEIATGFSRKDRQVIMNAIREYHKYTCLRFVPADRSDRNRIRFQDGNGCSSYVGMVGGAQKVTLGRNCRHRGVVIHEIGHAIGFHHEQTRPDRDNYVIIQKQNIKPKKEHNFKRYTRRQVSSYGVPYDYTSVMHYGQYAFSKNRKPTIIARDPKYQRLMGNRQGLSYRDIKLANLMYHCAANEKCQARNCPRDGFQGKDCKCWCPTNDRQNPTRHCDSEPVNTAIKPIKDVSDAICEDSKKLCPSWRKYCDVKVLVTYLMEHCKKTCGYC